MSWLAAIDSGHFNKHVVDRSRDAVAKKNIFAMVLMFTFKHPKPFPTSLYVISTQVKSIPPHRGSVHMMAQAISSR
jgi:hypothetical protein